MPVADVATDAAADTGAAGGAVGVVVEGGGGRPMGMAMVVVGAAAAGVTAVVVFCIGNRPVGAATTVPAGCCSGTLPVVVAVETDAAADRDARSRAVAVGMVEGGPLPRLLGWTMVPSGPGAGMPRGTSCGLPAGERLFCAAAPALTPACCCWAAAMFARRASYTPGAGYCGCCVGAMGNEAPPPRAPSILCVTL